MIGISTAELSPHSKENDRAGDRALQRQEPPEHLADRRATAADLATFDPVERQFRTCFHCSQAYLTVADAGKCEKFHETGTIGEEA